MSPNMKSWLVLIVALGFGCQTGYKGETPRPLSESEALSLAVTLANEECTKRFSQTPFNQSSFAIEFRDEHWRWGALDVHGESGFSAVVSFDAHGGDRTVVVFFSWDSPIPDPSSRE